MIIDYYNNDDFGDDDDDDDDDNDNDDDDDDNDKVRSRGWIGVRTVSKVSR